MSVAKIDEAFPGATTSPLLEEFDTGWYPGNTSIAQGPEGYAALVTCRDLLRHDDGTWTFADASGVIRTRNLFTRLDADLLPIAPWSELTPDLGPIVSGAVLGVEDPRLYWAEGWHYTGSIFQHHPSGEPRVAICSVESGLLGIADAPSGTWVKNLMPTGSTPEFIDIMVNDGSLHGGAVCRYGDRYLGIVHSVEWPGRRYHHYFALFDAAGTLAALTEPFTFDAVAIEFAAGIVLHDNRVIVSYGVQDRQSRLARMALEKVMGALCVR